jgi:hypothetical protein
VWGSEFTTKAVTAQGDSAELVPSPCVVALGLVSTRARDLVHEVARARKLAERRAQSSDHARPEVEEHRTGHVLAARGLVLNYVHAAELRVVVAEVLASAARAMLAASVPKTGCPSVYRTAPPACEQSRAKKQPGDGSTREKKGGGKSKNVRNSVWQFGKGK